MQSTDRSDIAITGIGAVSAIGADAATLQHGLLEGRAAFGVMQRQGRQIPVREGDIGGSASAFLGAEIAMPKVPTERASIAARSLSLTAQAALAALEEAWQDAGLDGVAPERIGLVVGGCNVQQRELVLQQDRYRGRETFLRPTYGMSFLDTDLCGLCTEVFGIRGRAWTVGGASASGQLAVIEAADAVASGRVDVCIAVGALMDLSYWECQGLRTMGAMGSDRHAKAPDLACRPFDTRRDGFIFGEACGAVVIRREGTPRPDGTPPYAALTGWAMAWDANRNPNPSFEGESTVIRKALAMAGLEADAIDYVNPHGTASRVGDETELAALRACGLDHAWINATKSLVGHGLTAAGLVELIAIMLQMRAGRLHPTRNLENPFDDGFRWVGASPVDHAIERALNMSMGFGGINTAVCLERCR